MQETQEKRVQSLGQEDPLEEEMAIHFSILAWEIPWTEEPGGLPSVMSQRVSHNRATEHTRLNVMESTAASHRSDRRDSPITRSQIKCNAEIKEWMLRLCLPAASWGSEDFANTRRHTARGKEPACQTQKTSKRLRFDPWSGRSREEGMTTRSSILAWRMPWTEEPGGLQSMGSQRVRHDWSDLAQHACVTAQRRDPGLLLRLREEAGPQLWRWLGQQGSPRALTTRTLGSYCRLFKELDFLSSISSMGEEEDSRELSEGLKEGLLLSPWSTRSELGRSSRAWKKSKPQSRLPPTQSMRLKLGPGGLLRQTTQQAWPVTPQNLWVWNHRII